MGNLDYENNNNGEEVKKALNELSQMTMTVTVKVKDGKTGVIDSIVKKNVKLFRHFNWMPNPPRKRITGACVELSEFITFNRKYYVNLRLDFYSNLKGKAGSMGSDHLYRFSELIAAGTANKRISVNKINRHGSRVTSRESSSAPYQIIITYDEIERATGIAENGRGREDLYRRIINYCSKLHSCKHIVDYMPDGDTIKITPNPEMYRFK